MTYEVNENPLVDMLRVLMTTHPTTTVSVHMTPSNAEDGYTFMGRLVAVSEDGKIVQLLEHDGELISIQAKNIICVRYTPPGTQNLGRVNLEGALIEVEYTEHRYVKQISATARPKPTRRR
jgi:hypothetical protein